MQQQRPSPEVPGYVQISQPTLKYKQTLVYAFTFLQSAELSNSAMEMSMRIAASLTVTGNGVCGVLQRLSDSDKCVDNFEPLITNRKLGSIIKKGILKILSMSSDSVRNTYTMISRFRFNWLDYTTLSVYH